MARRGRADVRPAHGNGGSLVPFCTTPVGYECCCGIRNGVEVGISGQRARGNLWESLLGQLHTTAFQKGGSSSCLRETW
jgi:hypothetical protein